MLSRVGDLSAVWTLEEGVDIAGPRDYSLYVSRLEFDAP